MEQIQFPAVAVVKAGPHKRPWLVPPTSMDTDMPEGQLVVVFERDIRLESDVVYVADNETTLDRGGCWCVHIDSLEIIDSWEK